MWTKWEGPALKAQILLLWDKRPSWHKEQSQAALCTGACVTNGSWNVRLPHSAALLYLHIPQLHRMTRGTKTLPKNPIQTKRTSKNGKKLFKQVQNGIARKPELTIYIQHWYSAKQSFAKVNSSFLPSNLKKPNTVKSTKHAGYPCWSWWKTATSGLLCHCKMK